MSFQIKHFYELKTGDIMLHPLYSKDGLLLINSYKKLTENTINIIKTHFPKHMISVVCGSDETLNSFISNAEYGDLLFIEKLQEVVQNYQRYFSKENITLKSFLDYRVTKKIKEEGNASDTTDSAFLTEAKQVKQYNVLFNSPLWINMEQSFESERLKSRTKLVKEEIESMFAIEKELYQLVESLKSYHPVLHNHSINTMIISLLLGVSLEMSVTQLKELAISSLFSNYGFSKLPQEEFKQFLKNEIELKELNKSLQNSIGSIRYFKICAEKDIINGILDHNENIDGTGLPNHKKENEIHLFGRIIRISQLYNQITGGYMYHTIKTSYEALVLLWNMRSSAVDSRILRHFFSSRNTFKVGNTVFLDNELKGIVLGFSDYINEPLKPIIELESGKIIDLAENDGRSIENIQL